MKITLVKKIFEDGSPCKKCAEVIARLEDKDQMRFIDDIVVADVRDPSSAGMQLAKKHNIDKAPFFVVDKDGGTAVYTVYMKFVKDVLSKLI